MDRIYNPDQTNDDRRFTEGDSVTDVEATPLDDKWLNDVQEELCAAVTMDGDALDPNDQAQLKAVIARRATKGDVQRGHHNSALAIGTANVIGAVFDPPVAALVDGMALNVRTALANAWAIPTFTPNSGVVNPKPIVKGPGNPLVAGDIAGGDLWSTFQYCESLDAWVLLNPTTPAREPVYVHVISQGSNANGQWRRWSDGKIEQWGVLVRGDMGANSGGSSAITLPITYPDENFHAEMTVERTGGNDTTIVRTGGNSFNDRLAYHINNTGVAATAVKIHWRTMSL